MKTVYLSHFSIVINPGENQFLPYSSATLWSYAQTQPDIVENYQLGGMFFEKQDYSQIVDSLDNPSVFGMSCYVWNANFNDGLAQLIKQRYPQCLIVYGGPHLPQTADDDWWAEHPYVDAVVYYEGEKKRVQMHPSEMIEPGDFRMFIFNFEDQWIDKTQKKFLEWSQNVFAFDSVTSIVLVRDPFNLFASRSKDDRIKLIGEEAKALYKSHMNIAMNSVDFVDINYNRWFADRNYRKILSDRLNIPFTDEGLNDIIWPGESTFNGSGYDGRAQEMNVFERWKQIGADSLEIDMDDELCQYAKDYFDILVE